MKNALRILRVERDLTREELANKIHVSRLTIITGYNGEYNPSVKLPLKIAAVFNTSSGIHHFNGYQ